MHTRRLRAIGVTVPIMASLLLLLVAGLFRPSLVEAGPSAGFFHSAVVTVGSLTTLSVLAAAARARGRQRAAWSAVAATTALWTAAVLATLGEHELLAWGVLRPGFTLTGLVALLLAPGILRRSRDWGLVVLDGWLVGGSVFLIGWCALIRTGSVLSDDVLAGRPSLPWVAVDLVFVSIVCGLAMRTRREAWFPVLMMVLAALLAVTGECTWTLAGEPPFAVVQWLIMMAAIAACTLGPDGNVWRALPEGPDRPRHLRWSQLAVVPGLAAAIGSPAGPVVSTIAISVIIALVVEILLAGRQNAELWEALRSQADRLDLLVQESRDAIVQVDGNGLVEFANPAVAEVFGVPPETLTMQPFARRVHSDDQTRFLEQISQLTTMPPTASLRIDSRIQHTDGTVRHIEATVSRRLRRAGEVVPVPSSGRYSGSLAGYTLLARDVTERSRRDAELRTLASSDTLTGLLNRHAFLEALGGRLRQGPAAVLFLDLDGFKTVNDVHGHAAGDRLLVEAARELRGAIGGEDVAARLGGDEFAVLVGGADRGRACAVAARVAARLARLHCEIPGAAGTSASVGVAVGQGVGAEVLLAQADRAMYQAKSWGGGRWALAQEGFQTRSSITA